MNPQQGPELSACHQAPMTVEGMGDFDDNDKVVTQYHVCTACNEMCNPYTGQPQPDPSPLIFITNDLPSLLEHADAVKQPEPDELDAILEPLRKYSLSVAFDLELDKAKAALQALSSRRTAAVLERLKEHKTYVKYHVVTVARPSSTGYAVPLSAIDAEIEKLNQEGH